MINRSTNHFTFKDFKLAQDNYLWFLITYESSSTIFSFSKR